jgi:CO/xanthine dehydrogenase FAD-binding subunit
MAAGEVRLLAGGTDVYPALLAKSDPRPLLDLTALPGLSGLSRVGGMWRIGALTRWSTIARAELPLGFAALQQASKEIGGWQIQNSGTLGGNLCNASPAADGVPPLLALDAQVELTRSGASRVLPLSAFILGNRRTALEQGEILTAILLPDPGQSARSVFLKLGQRRSLVISIAMVACGLSIEAGIVRHAAIAVGACSEVAQRLPALEAVLIGRKAEAGLAACVTEEHLIALKPIDDIRATASYRRQAALELTRRALVAAVEAAHA